MKELIFIAILFSLSLPLLSGCLYQVTDQTDILKAEQFCKDHLGIKDIVVSFGGTEDVHCVDGNSINMDIYELEVTQ